MTSTLGCIGLAVADQEAFGGLIEQMFTTGARRSSDDGVTSTQWTDRSGARVTFGDRDGRFEDLVPSYAGGLGATLGGLTLAADGVGHADVLEDGEMVTRLAADLVQWRAVQGPVTGPAAITALGVDVSVHADEAAYSASDASLLGGREEGKEPMRMASSSFISYGLFAGDGSPTAQLAGVSWSRARTWWS